VWLDALVHPSCRGETHACRLLHRRALHCVGDAEGLAAAAMADK
jgi:hypothetical protein